MSISIETILMGHGIGSGKGIEVVKSETEPTTGLSEGLIWYNTASKSKKIYINGQFEAIGSDGTFFSKASGQHKTTAITNTVPIVLDGAVFKAGTDFLIATKNTIPMTEGVDYRIDPSTNRIVKISGDWESGVTFRFEAAIVTTVPDGGSLAFMRLEDDVDVIAGVQDVSFGIPGFNPRYDVLEVYQRNLPIFKDKHWTLNPDQTSIHLTYVLEEADEFHFVVTKKIRDDASGNSIDGSFLLNNSVTEEKLSVPVIEKLIDAAELRDEVGVITELQTTDKTNTVNAINEINGQMTTLSESVASGKSYTIIGSGNFNSTTGTVINHSIGTTNYIVEITPTQNPAGYLGEYWVEKAMNSFSVKCSGTATTSFDYVVFE